MRALSVAVALALFALVLGGCGDENEKYKPQPAYSGKKPNLPAMPQLRSDPIRVGDAYSIYGAIHQLKSRYHSADVTSKDITIQGYIVDSNIPTAPACAV